MRFWDASAFVPLHVEQRHSGAVRDLIAEDAELLAWVLTDIEVGSAFERLRRTGALPEEAFASAVRDFEGVWNAVRPILSIDPVKMRARRLLSVHALRAADALQLAAALVAASDEPRRLELVCLDRHLAGAARREGFLVVP